MDKTEIQDKIENILNQSRVGVLSTAHHNVPNSRYMMFYNDDLTLYTKTSKEPDVDKHKAFKAGRKITHGSQPFPAPSCWNSHFCGCVSAA